MVDRVEWDADWERSVARMAVSVMDMAADIVENEQRRRIPVSRDGSYGRPPGYARNRIRTDRGTDAQGRHWDIGSTATTPDGTSYPAILDLGSRPHVIESRGPWPLRNRRTGQVFGRRVHHPGTRATHWCRGSLEILRGRRL